MRFDNRHARIRTLAATTVVLTAVMLGACRPSVPASSASDTSTAGTAIAETARSDSVLLRTDKSQYHAGETITLTFENKSARTYAFNPCTRTIEHDVNGTWTALPDAGRMCTMEAWILDPHGTRTGPTELPTPMALGRYRVVVRMSIQSADASSAAPINAVSDPITVS